MCKRSELNKKPLDEAFCLPFIIRQLKFFVYNENNQVIGEYDVDGNVIAEYLYFGLRPVAVKTNGVLVEACNYGEHWFILIWEALYY